MHYVTHCEESCFANQLIFAQLAETVIVKPFEGKEADLQVQLDAHVTYFQENAAFYPEQEPAANGTAVEQSVKNYISG